MTAGESRAQPQFTGLEKRPIIRPLRALQQGHTLTPALRAKECLPLSFLFSDPRNDSCNRHIWADEPLAVMSQDEVAELEAMSP